MKLNQNFLIKLLWVSLYVYMLSFSKKLTSSLTMGFDINVYVSVHMLDGTPQAVKQRKNTIIQQI